MNELNALFETQVSNVMSGMVRANAFSLEAGPAKGNTGDR